MLSSYEIAYVKWDHNRNLFDASGSAGTPGVHAQTVGFYQLLDALRAAHPSVELESCASGGGRIDLGVIERVERFWTSDATDALSRQQIQRWTGQLIAPEYLGAHVSAPVNHQTGRTLSLDLRAATAFFADFGVEWDLTRAGAAELHRLAEWIAAYKQHRRLLHSGRIVRGDFAVPEVLIHGVIAEDGREAVLAYVQMGEFVSDPPPFLIPGLNPFTPYVARSILPTVPLESQPADEVWPGEGVTITGAALQAIGLPPPSRQPESAHLVHLSADPRASNVLIDQESP
jgi:alpha-galactosidase